MKDVTVVIPTLNESETIGLVLDDVLKYTSDILVLDGGSQDQTVQLAEEKGVRVEFDGGGGKGNALKLAPEIVSTEVIVYMDADGSHIASDIEKLATPILEGRADIVVASRLLGGSSELHGGFDEFLRLSGSSFITTCINWKFGCRISDSQNGFRAIRTSLMASLNCVSNHTTIEQEMIARALGKGGRILEIASHEYPRRGGVSKVDPIRHAPQYVWSLLRDVLLK